jgi:hypothetical protein
VRPSDASSESNGSGGWFVYMYKKCDKKVYTSVKEHLNVKKERKKRKKNWRRRISKPRPSGKRFERSTECAMEAETHIAK